MAALGGDDAEEELDRAAATEDDEAAAIPVCDPWPVLSRLSRLMSLRISAALWYRRSISFSSALSMISSSLRGTEGFSSPGGRGLRSRMPWKMTAEVFPSNGSLPVAIS